MTGPSSTADDFFAPLNDALLRTLDEDDAMTVAADIPDGWAKLDGRWVRLIEADPYKKANHGRGCWIQSGGPCDCTARDGGSPINPEDDET